MSAIFAASAFVGCNSDYTPAENTSSSVVVYSFNLSKDDSVVANLDTVFFSIDLDRARIYNADSLPFGTKTDKLVPVIKMLESASAATLTVRRADGTDTLYNYLTNSTDTIDFSNGPVLLNVVSPSGAFSTTYTIEVLVHQLKGDSLVWDKMARRPLPTQLANVKEQRTVRNDKGIYTLTSDGYALQIAYAARPDASSWDYVITGLPSGADISSFAAAGSDLYIIVGDLLYRSPDGGLTWNSTGAKWSHIYGAYDGRVIGAMRSGAAWMIDQYPSVGSPVALPSGMPVSGTSVPVEFSFPMSDASQIVMVGGKKTDGSLSPDAWAFDGSQWARISTTSLPVGLKNVTVVPFFTFVTNSAYVATEYSVLLAFGGNDGTTNNADVYISNDYGMTWAKGESLIQLPDYISPMHSAQAYVYDSVLGSRSADGLWTSLPLSYRIPASARLEYMPFAGSRATEPITTWNCPFIYVFGGVDNTGALSQTIWRATLNCLTFKPIQ